MAVIREKRQFRIGTIGVARASQGSQIVGETIARSANALGDMFYKEAAQAAEKGGMEAGASADREKVITINPETGEPEAYAPPEGMGSIGADAYQRVVMRRFQQSIEDEIRNKGRELAARYDGSPAMYESAMSDYLASMTNVAQDEFRGFITDVGTSYLNATMTNMQIAQVRRERAAARASQEAAIEDGLGNIEMMVAQNGPASLQGPTVEASLISSVAAAANDGGEAGLFGADEIARYGRDGQAAIARGLIRYAASQTEDPETLARLQSAIGTQNPAAVPAEFPDVAQALRGFGSNFSGLADLERFSDGLLSDAIAGAKIIQQREVASQEAQTAQLLFDMGQNLPAIAFGERAFAMGRGPLAVAVRAGNYWEQATELARSEAVAGREEISDQYLEQRNAVLAAQSEGLYARALSGLSTEQTNALENAISNRNLPGAIMLAPESARLELNALMRMEAATGQPILQEFLPHISEYRRAAGKDIDLMLRNAAAQEALGVNVSSILFSENLGQDVRDTISQVNAIANLDSKDAETMRDSILVNASRNNLNAFFGNAYLTTDQLREAKSIFEGGTAQEGVLTDEQIAQVGQARAYALEAGQISELRTTFNSQKETVTARIAEREARGERDLLARRINNGQASPTIKENRELYEEGLASRFARGQDISAIWGSSDSLTNPIARNILNDVVRARILPQSLHQTFASLANGEFRIGDPNAVLSHYINVRNYNFEGQVVKNPAIDSLSPSQITVLDYLADSLDVQGNVGPETLAEVYARMDAYKNDPRVQSRVEATLEGSLDDFVLNELDGIEDVPLSALSAMKDSALELVSTGANRNDIIDRLNRQIERTYPDGNGYVVNSYGGSRTRFALPLVALGHEDLFKDHVRNVISQFSNLEGQDFSFGGKMAGPYRRIDEEVYLVPLDASSDGTVRYTVKRVRPLEDGGDETVNGTFAEGETFYSAPIIISNRDPRFTAAVDQANLLAQEEELKRAEESEVFSGTGPGSFMQTIFGADE